MIFLTMILGLLPGLIWIFFYLQEDPHPEPKRMILVTFIVGAMMAIPVIILQLLTQDALNFFSIKNIIVSIIALALIEEFFKFIAAFWVTYKNPEFDEPIDAMVYIITAALGFATVENVLIMGNIFSLATTASLTASISTAFSTMALRFIGATLLHTLSSGLVGYYWAKRIIKKSRLYLIYGFFWAVLTHSVFNYLIIKFQSVNFLIPSLFLILGAIFVIVDFEKLRKMV